MNEKWSFPEMTGGAHEQSHVSRDDVRGCAHEESAQREPKASVATLAVSS